MLLACFVGLAEQTLVPIIVAALGMWSVWFYLRFWMNNEGNRGDPSIEMAFMGMFPGPLRPLARWIGTVAYACAARLDKWRLLDDGYVDLEHRASARRPSAQEIERRRQLALHLLDKKIAEKQANSPKTSPGMFADFDGRMELPQPIIDSGSREPNRPMVILHA